MITVRDVSLKRLMNCPTRDGIMFFTAWGMTMNRIVWTAESPTARAASVCPRGTDWMPARTISPT